MPRKRYDQILTSLRDDIMRLGKTVEDALNHVMTSLETANVTTAGWVIRDDAHIDAAQFTIEERVANVLATQQPVVASDLRLINVIIASATELERIGDYASGIGKRVQRLRDTPVAVDPPPELFEMATVARQMLHTSLEAFMHQDSDRARRLKEDDNRVDEFETSLRAHLIDLARTDPRRIDAVVHLLDVVHLLERVADRATNIAERVIYLVNSDTEELNP